MRSSPTSAPSGRISTTPALLEISRACALTCLVAAGAAFTSPAWACTSCEEEGHAQAESATVVVDRLKDVASRSAASTSLSTVSAAACSADAKDLCSVKQLGMVMVRAVAPTSLPASIPTTLETIGASDIARSINATDSEDALKYMPSLLVRKRYPGDYNHAVLSTRASGTGNSARSMVFADGILISNLLGNGATFAPRWGLVTPEEIERVDVLYGPFSAAYAGNSAGAVVDYRTRMPTQFEAHAKVGVFHQPFSLYGHSAIYGGTQASASLGDRAGALSWWFHVERLQSDGQPLTFVTKPVSTAAPAPGATPVSGAVPNLDKNGKPWQLLGAGTQYDTRQDQAEFKLAYDITPTLKATATFAWWDNQSDNHSQSWLKDSTGAPFYASPINSGSTKPSNISIGGAGYSLAASDFPQAADQQLHTMQGVSLRSNTRSEFDFELAASRYDYAKDTSSSALTARPGSETGGAGRITDLSGTGWHTLSARTIWRPNAAHVVEGGLQQDTYVWRQRQFDTPDWRSDERAGLFTAFSGRTRLTSLYGQDAWQIAPTVKAVLGLRGEQWTAKDGSKTASNGQVVDYASRCETFLSPKAAVGFEVSPDWTIKASVGRAVRMPTVSELYQGGVSTTGTYIPGDPATNPDLQPERSWTGELSAIWSTEHQTLRATLFHEDTRGALYSQTAFVDGRNVSSTQNIDHVRTRGVELAWQASPEFASWLELQGSATYADSIILANQGFVTVPGDTVGRQQPRVPRWRGTLRASVDLSHGVSLSYGARYSGRQYGALDNSDINGFAYQGFSKYFTTDLRMQWKVDRHWTVAGGIDNLNNYKYWAFHPYPQRTFHAELRYSL